MSTQPLNKDIRLGLENLYSQPSANRRGGGTFPSSVPVPSTTPPKKYPVPVGQSESGSYRQPPNIPSSVPTNLPKGLPNRSGQAPRPTKQYSPYNLPNPRQPLVTPQKLANTATAVGNGAARAAGLVVVGQQVTNLIKDFSLGNVVTTVGAGLTAIPNPYAQVVGFGLAITGALINAFKPQENQSNTSVGNTDQPSGQTFGQDGKSYRLVFQAELQTNPPQLVTRNARGRGGQINGFQGTVTVSDSYEDTNIGFWVFNVTDSQGSFTAGADFEAPSNFTQNAKYTKPTLVAIIEIDSGNPVPVPPLPSDNNQGSSGNTSSNALPVNNDGWFPADIQGLKDRVDQLSNNFDFSQIAIANNGLPVAVPTRTPQTLPNPNDKDNDDKKNKPLIPSIFNPFENGNIPSFQAKPFVSGVSDPSERFNPVDEKTGLTREQFDQKILEERQKALTKQNANIVAAKKNDDNVNEQLRRQTQPQSTVQPTRTPVTDKINDPLKVNQNSPVGKPVPSTNPVNNPSPTTNEDRFKKPTDCKFSCSALADCFVDLQVSIFDGCNDDGTAKTKQITIQVLPKDTNRTKEVFAELLRIRSNECEIEGKVITVPEYWLTRVGQIPQAEILYKSVPTNASDEPSYYQLQIPHYNGSKSSKPKISAYQKGEEYGIYKCKDGSTIMVYASTRQECLRVITELERYVNPRMRTNKDAINYGTRKGLIKVRVVPVRLDFSATGQAAKRPDYSISLKAK